MGIDRATGREGEEEMGDGHYGRKGQFLKEGTRKIQFRRNEGRDIIDNTRDRTDTKNSRRTR